MKQKRFLPCALLAGLLAVWTAQPVMSKEPALILPHPALLRAQLLLRQAEQAGAVKEQPGAVLALQAKINAAWSAYHLQVEEEADDPDDDEAILARRLAEQAVLDAALLQVSLRTLTDEARLDARLAARGSPPPERLAIPPPPPAEAGSR